MKPRFDELGFETDLRLPDEQDALGGILDVIRDSALVQIVNYANPFRATTRAAHDAIANAEFASSLQALTIADAIVGLVRAGREMDAIDPAVPSLRGLSAR